MTVQDILFEKHSLKRKWWLSYCNLQGSELNVKMLNSVLSIEYPIQYSIEVFTSCFGDLLFFWGT